ncbi:uncharacterized protein B0H18DRAFT_1006448 [Fomitopsis serialis]|uniref:uncharacterized protein n=1 Tax=Fomitopsis serialis TaxID=139415 RepID=UPI0020084D3C|nr:uncharacterized protein B0H18DRAFT_1006448 [Neoantrodia serialis]KAH9926501.1 hypothetical protein B0H18DRAFT_1006448 [Neoantrodia serialis]
MANDKPRASKRRKVELKPSAEAQSAEASATFLRPLPPAVLLISLPALLAHPPNHKYYIPSLVLSLTALRKCLTLSGLSPEIECRAWTGLAEIGMKVISGGLSQSEDCPWALGIETEVEKAISKGSIIAQKHPSLRPYKLHLSLLQVQLSQWQHKSKFARTQLRKLFTSFLPSDPPHAIYSVHLAYINLLLTPSSTSTPSSSSAPPSTPVDSPQDIHAALSAVEALAGVAHGKGHKGMVLLSRVLRLRILVAANMWADVPEALQAAEKALGLSYQAAATPKPRKPGEQDEFITFEDTFESAMVVHLLMMAVIFYTHVGNAAEASPRLSHLHALMDSGVLDKFPDGMVEIPLPKSAPVVLQVTHPRILFLLTFLVSATSKRDAVGRKPKRKVFAQAGLDAWDNHHNSEISFALWAGIGDVEEVEQRLARIRADLLCEVIALSIMRSEFDSAKENLNILIAHARTYDIFPLFAARIALHHGHLAHALGQFARASQCYQAAASHSEPDSFVHVAARASGFALRLGLKQRERGALNEGEDEDALPYDRDMVDEGMHIAQACKGMGGTLDAVGQVLLACLTPEILAAKQHLKKALNLATVARDNHLRALILALIASHYFHTAGDHALEMLQTCEQLAAGLGAPADRSKPDPSSKDAVVPVGNAPLGLWVGERFLELFRRAGKEARVQKQLAHNNQLSKAVEDLARRGAEGRPPSKNTS